MSIKSFFTGVRGFLSPDELELWLRKKWGLADDVKARRLLFFETSKQHTWLIAAQERIACVLDDVRKPEPVIRWEMSHSEVIEGEKIKLPLNPRERTQWTGLIDFGPDHKNWLFSKKLFTDQPIENEIASFIKSSKATG